MRFDFLKKPVIYLLIFLWIPLRPFFQLKTFPDRIKKIVIIFPGGLGDILLHTPAINLLHKKFPSAEIVAYVPEYGLKIMKHIPYISRVRVKKAFFKMIKEIKKERFDLGINFDIFSDNLKLFLGKVNYRVGYNIHFNDLLLNNGAKFQKDRHVIFYALDVVNIIPPFKKIKKEDTKLLFINLPKNVRTSKKIFHNKLNVGVVPGGGNNPWKDSPEKRIPLSYLERVISSVGDNSVFFLFGNEKDSALGNRLIQNLGKNSPKIINLIGKTSIAEAAFFLKKMDFLITPDTFLMHLSVAMDTPTISFFFSTNPKRLKPLTQKNLVMDLRKRKLNEKDLNSIKSFIGQLQLSKKQSY